MEKDAIVIAVGQIVDLNDNKSYVITEIVNYNNSRYCYLIEVDAEENVKDTYLIAKEIIVDGDVYLLDIEDQAEYTAVLQLFKDALL
ncbi:MAG: DUF1292 domain-containing protein [bacterium]|nr:DUF1292 domain-containing protein [bacterium]